VAKTTTQVKRRSGPGKTGDLLSGSERYALTFNPNNTIMFGMKLNIAEITHSFAPKIRYVEVEGLFRLSDERKINNDTFYTKIQELTEKAHPSYKDKTDTKWEYFYLPMKRKGRLICIPFSVVLYRSVYYVWFHGFSGFGWIAVNKGNDKFYYEDYLLFIDEAIRFIPLLKETGNTLIERTFPLDLRRGKIRGKYIREKNELMPEKERKEIEEAYKNHLEKKLTVDEISLNEYLNTAAICYRAAFKKEKTKVLTPLEMYKRWADNRDGGMLDIDDPDSKKEYMDWLNSGKWSGTHPFEIVYSFIELGIHLYPPRLDKPCFGISVSYIHLTAPFVDMVGNLIKHNVPFEAYQLDEALDYLTGESFIDVNIIGLDSFHYYPSRENRKKYYPHIQWDKIEVVKFK
jgi:hypothetical protein